MLDRINIDNANVLAGSSSITTHESDSMTKVSNYLAHQVPKKRVTFKIAADKDNFDQSSNVSVKAIPSNNYLFDRNFDVQSSPLPQSLNYSPFNVQTTPDSQSYLFADLYESDNIHCSNSFATKPFGHTIPRVTGPPTLSLSSSFITVSNSSHRTISSSVHSFAAAERGAYSSSDIRAPLSQSASAHGYRPASSQFGRPSSATFLPSFSQDVSRPNSTVGSGHSFFPNSTVGSGHSFFPNSTVGSGHSFSLNSRPYVAQTSPGFIFNVPPTNQIDPASLHLIKQSLLQKPERPYNGEPHLYQSFMSQLETKVKGIPLDAWDRILILEAHTTGKPQQVDRSHMTNGSADSSATLEDILGELKRKFGLGTKVAATIINKIEDLQLVKSIHNTERLEELLEISKLIRTNLSSTEELQKFNGSIGIQKLWSKLPEPFQNSWRTVCNDHKQCSYNEHPPFERFFDFLKRKVEEYSDCV